MSLTGDSICGVVQLGQWLRVLLVQSRLVAQRIPHVCSDVLRLCAALGPSQTSVMAAARGMRPAAAVATLSSRSGVDLQADADLDEYGRRTVLDIDDLVRVAWLYAATAVEFCLA